MTHVSKNFLREEFACKCGVKSSPVNVVVVLILLMLSWLNVYRVYETTLGNQSPSTQEQDVKSTIEPLEAQTIANTLWEKQLTSWCKDSRHQRLIDLSGESIRISMVSECTKLGITWM